jgi:amino acid transporter
LTAVTLVVTRGIKHSSYTQLTLTVFETAILLALIIGAFIKYSDAPMHPPSMIWISPVSFTPQVFATGALTAIFFFWGWDVTMNLSEESRSNQRGGRGCGVGAFWSVLNMMLFLRS